MTSTGHGGRMCEHVGLNTVVDQRYPPRNSTPFGVASALTSRQAGKNVFCSRRNVGGGVQKKLQKREGCPFKSAD
jgi:hypothetical protein